MKHLTRFRCSIIRCQTNYWVSGLTFNYWVSGLTFGHELSNYWVSGLTFGHELSIDYRLSMRPCPIVRPDTKIGLFGSTQSTE
jgi:hypothetical protein